MAKENAISLAKVADEFDMISEDWYQYYNRETGEFVSFHPDFNEDDIDPEDFEGDEYVSLPSQRDLNEYDIMAEFADTVKNPHQRELLVVALNGRGAFRRFKDVVNNAGIDDAWYAYRGKALLNLAREWCEENDIRYVE